MKPKENPVGTGGDGGLVKWEKDFEREFDRHLNDCEVYRQIRLKSFISSLLEREKGDTYYRGVGDGMVNERAKIAEVVRGMRQHYEKGSLYDEALNDVLSSLEEKI